MEKKYRADFPQHIDRTKNRSDHYQPNILEISVAPDVIARAVDDDEVSSMLDPFSYNEEEEELKEQLRQAFWRLVNTELTERQKQVITLYCQKYTQTEIASILHVNQSSVTKSMNGNCDYKKNNGKKSSYGGSRRRLQKLSESDEEIQEILRKLREVRDI